MTLPHIFPKIFFCDDKEKLACGHKKNNFNIVMINLKFFKNIFKKDIKHNFCHYIMGYFCDKIMPKIFQKFYCKICHYGTSKKSSYTNYLLSLKHKKRVFSDACDANYALIMPFEKKYICEKCEKYYIDYEAIKKHVLIKMKNNRKSHILNRLKIIY
jgi:hypothetical protein